MIVGFYFCCNTIAFVEAHYARVVFKNADAPFRRDFFGGFGYVGFEEAVDFFAVDADFSLERFVVAVFAPRLPDSLEFNVGWVSFLRFEVGLDLLHFVQA